MITSTNTLTPDAPYHQGAKEPTDWCQGETGTGRVASAHLARPCTVPTLSYLSSGSLHYRCAAISRATLLSKPSEEDAEAQAGPMALKARP